MILEAVTMILVLIVGFVGGWLLWSLAKELADFIEDYRRLKK